MDEEHKEHHGGEHHTAHKEDSVTISNLTLWKISAGILGVLLIISIFTGGFGIGSNSDGTAPSPAKAQPSAPSVNMDDLIDDDAVKGDANSPVTIIEWSDFECPFCERFYSQTLGQIEEKYIKTGKVRFVYRDYPLGFHPNAQKAAEAAECAGEQGKFWEMHDQLFEKGVKGGVSGFKQYAADIKLDTSKFNSCLDSGKMASETAKDMQDGQAAGITGTPGFIINGQLISGAQPFSVFQQIIEAELAK